jgi:hypothetical protein
MIRGLAVVFLLSLGWPLPVCAEILFVERVAYVHHDGSLHTVLDDSSAEYSESLSNGLGTFGWTFTNLSGRVLDDLTILTFVDIDIDPALNSSSNEYGEFVGPLGGLPVIAVVRRVDPTSWEIDEPGFVFGDIRANLIAATLDNANAVPASRPDDVSIAFGFMIGELAVADTVTVSLLVQQDGIGGLRHLDPDSDTALYINGVATIPLVSAVPEPPTALLVLAGIALAGRSGWRRRRSTRRYLW